MLRQKVTGMTLEELQERMPTADIKSALDRLIELKYVRKEGDLYIAEFLGNEDDAGLKPGDVGYKARGDS